MKATAVRLREGLAGRRILFIGIGFYDYEEQITRRLREYGAQVTVFHDRPLILREGPLAGFIRFFRLEARTLLLRHERHILRCADTVPFDQVVVIKGVGLSIDLLVGLRRRQPQAEFVLYQWDSIRRLPGIAELLPHFDRVLSFDRLDVLADNRLIFRPLFFRETLAKDSKKPDIDICFVGHLHSDRLDQVRCMEANAKALGMTMYVYLFTGVLTWMRLKLRGEGAGVHLRPIPYARLMALHHRSRCVLDLPHPEQTGLTMRAIEALGLGRKLITTAQDIVNYDFYRPQNVHIAQEATLFPDCAFVRDRPEPLPQDIINSYSLDAWLADVMLSHSS
jgi:hypothetical protein